MKRVEIKRGNSSNSNRSKRREHKHSWRKVEKSPSSTLKESRLILKKSNNSSRMSTVWLQVMTLVTVNSLMMSELCSLV